jgi:hypothetical protein
MDFPHAILARVYEHVEPIDRGVATRILFKPSSKGRASGE